MRVERLDPAAFIRAHTRLMPVKSLPEIRLYTAHEATGLWRLNPRDDDDPPPPYWAFPWAGGLALARYILDTPDAVAGKRILDLGAGSGLVAIAAAKAGAAQVSAAEIDPYGLAAIPLNAAANGVAVTVVAGDITGGPALDVDMVAVGDLFYEEALAKRVIAFLDRCLVGGITVIIGDPHRAYLPYARLTKLAEYSVPDVGDVEGEAVNASGVYRFA